MNGFIEVLHCADRGFGWCMRRVGLTVGSFNGACCRGAGFSPIVLFGCWECVMMRERMGRTMTCSRKRYERLSTPCHVSDRATVP